MNSKLTLPDIIAALSQHTGLSRSVCDRFIKSTFTIVADTIVAGENVKIRGLGTFKASEVGDRKSVNVNTGAEIIIPGHKKVTFSPDKALAELINSPFALFEAVELNDDVTEQMLSQAETPVEGIQMVETELDNALHTSSPVSGITQSAQSGDEDSDGPQEQQNDLDTGIQEQLPNSEEVEQGVNSEQESVQENNNITSQEDLYTTQVNVEPPHSEPPAPPVSAPAVPPALMAENTDSIDSPSDEEVSNDNSKVEIHVHSPECHAPRFRKGLYIGAVAAVIGIVLLMTGWRLLFPESFCTVTGTQLVPNEQQEISETVTEAVPAVYVTSNVDSVSSDTLHEDERIKPLEKHNEADVSVAPTKESDTRSRTKAEPAKVYDTITTKRFLTTMAKEHYGDYNLWPYIYDENRSILGHPDRIKPGTRVVIPPADKYGIDAGNPECVKRAKRRGVEIYAKYR